MTNFFLGDVDLHLPKRSNNENCFLPAFQYYFEETIPRIIEKVVIKKKDGGTEIKYFDVGRGVFISESELPKNPPTSESDNPSQNKTY